VEAEVRHFACTQCGKCCNRPPEVELSEAAPLADVFVFRLMFRLYWLPRSLADYRHLRERTSDAVFYQKKRLLSAFAAHRSSVRSRRNGKAVEHTKYLMISALALDTNPDACSALNGNRCSIYDRRPLSCRSVPLHYSRAEALARKDLAAFVETPGYECDTSDTAPIVLDAGRIADLELLDAREKALGLAQHDRPWSRAIVRRMKTGPSANALLPSLSEIEENAPFGATTTSMRVAWQIAAGAGLIGADEFRALLATQLSTIGRQLRTSGLSEPSRQTLGEMQSEYRQALG
jgi:Fe-S-cluster containining protein